MLDSILCGDSLELLKSLPDGIADLVFTSPPYYNAREYASYSSYSEYLNFIKCFVELTYSVMSDDGFFILNTSPVIIGRKSRNRESTRVPIPFDSFHIAQEVGFRYIDDIIWKKPDGASSRAVKFSAHRRPMAYKPFVVTEYLFVFRKKSAPLIDLGIRKHDKEVIRNSLVLDGYERTNIWEIPPRRDKEHPAPFPLKLAEKIIRYYTFIGDVVLDPFCGVGTALIAAKNLDRRYIGIDKERKYTEAAKIRLA